MIEKVRFLGAAGMFCRRTLLIAAAGISMFHCSVTVYAWEDDQTAVRTEGGQARVPNADSQESRHPISFALFVSFVISESVAPLIAFTWDIAASKPL